MECRIHRQLTDNSTVPCVSDCERTLRMFFDQIFNLLFNNVLGIIIQLILALLFGGVTPTA